MAVTLNGPFNVIAGQATNLPTPQGGGGAGTTTSLVVFNNTSAILVVLGPNGSNYLMPNMAGLFTGPGPAQGQYSVSPLTTNPNGTYMGTVSIQWAANATDLAGSYPQPLVPFPGGGFTVFSDVNLGPNAVTPVPLVIAPPSDTGFLVFQASGQISAADMELIQVVGVQSGVVYSTGFVQSAAENSITLNVIESVDTLYSVRWAPSLRPTTPFTCVAQPIPAIPTFANIVVPFAVGNGGLALAAPNFGAWWLFSWIASVGTVPEAPHLIGSVSGVNYGSVQCVTSGGCATDSGLIGPRRLQEYPNASDGLLVFDSVTSQNISGTLFLAQGP